LNQTIQGWIEGIPYFKEGGSGTLLIPAHLAYGSDNYRGIPGGSVIIFDVKLISVNKEKKVNSKQSKRILPIIQ
jgi:FKBP-type peptidyl-prolyl cis-trans isomerase FkpA